MTFNRSELSADTVFIRGFLVRSHGRMRRPINYGSMKRELFHQAIVYKAFEDDF